ncbi:MAG: hypothetical protein RBS88_07030 [Spongiibacteraceae bacterium]|jgi:hypothetical protein|nr:hypothetical protein [Spongiibacteraceae bacterium]
MRRARLTLATVVALATGCATLQPSAPFDVTIWREQVAAAHFRTAENTLTQAALSEEQREELHEELTQAVARYENDVLTKLNQLAERRQFNRADQLILEAQAALPRSEGLARFLVDYQTLRAAEERAYLNRLLVLRGEHLIAERKHILPLRAFAGSPAARRHIERHDESVREVAAQLARQGQDALANGRLNNAVRYLSLAQELSPNEEVGQFLAQAAAAQEVERIRRASATQQALQQTYDRLAQEAQQALASGDFAGARNRVAQMKRLAPSFRQSDDLAAAIDTAVALHTAELMEQGDKWYAEGRIERALRVWRQAHELTPTPQLSDRIARAERFLDRYREIKNGNAASDSAN